MSTQQWVSTQGRQSTHPLFGIGVLCTAQAATGLECRQLQLDLSTRGRLCPPLSYCSAGGDEPVKTLISQRAEQRIHVFIGRRDRCERRAVTRLTASGRGATRSRVRARQPEHSPPRDFGAAAGAELARAETAGAAPRSDLFAAQKPRKLSFIYQRPLALLPPARASGCTPAVCTRASPWASSLLNIK